MSEQAQTELIGLLAETVIAYDEAVNVLADTSNAHYYLIEDELTALRAKLRSAITYFRSITRNASKEPTPS